MKWILILTINLGGINPRGGVAMQEFNSEDTCKAAGSQWLKKLYGRNERNSIFFICAKK